MKTAIEIYNSIMDGTPKIDSTTIFSQYLTADKFHSVTSRISFEKMVWMRCNPDKKLANEVMLIADQKLKESNIQIN